MKILLINNDGGGFADHIEVSDGITVSELFRKQCPNRKPTESLFPMRGDRCWSSRFSVMPGNGHAEAGTPTRCPGSVSP